MPENTRTSKVNLEQFDAINIDHKPGRKPYKALYVQFSNRYKRECEKTQQLREQIKDMQKDIAVGESIITEKNKEIANLEIKLAKALENTKTESCETPQPEVMVPDYETENKTLKAKIAELEKVCQTLSRQTQQTQQNLQRAALEYDAHMKHALDCTRHAYISMQLASKCDFTNLNIKGDNND